MKTQHIDIYKRTTVDVFLLAVQPGLSGTSDDANSTVSVQSPSRNSVNGTTTTFAGCQCLNPWYASKGTQLNGVCRIGNDETQVGPSVTTLLKPSDTYNAG